MSEKITLGLSPCPNDTFIFHALLSGLTAVPYAGAVEVEPVMADVEELNKLAVSGSLMASKISLGVVPVILDRYRLLSAGAALGWGCGPLVVARRPMGSGEIEKAPVLVPGKSTTANLLLNLHGGFRGPRVEMLFSEIMPALTRGDFELGVIIHEGRFTFHKHGLCKIVDLGEWWEENRGLPLPLGAIAVRRDVPPELARALEKGIAQSLEHAWKNPAASRPFIKRHAQELSEEVIQAHINTFVTRYSAELGKTGRQAIRALLGSGGNPAPESIFLSE